MPTDPTDPTMTLFSLAGRAAIVTGASRGIGWTLADALARAGASVMALARSATPDFPLPNNVTYEPCDVLDVSTLEQCRDDLLSRTGRLDILINAAGVSTAGLSLDDFDEAIAVNLKGSYLCMHAVIPVMTAARRGSIINVTSLAAHRGFPGNPGYVAAKGGLRQLTRAIAIDLGSDNVRVNNIVPGYFETEMTRSSFSDPREHERREKHTMLGRWGQPSDLIGAVIFLASDASAYVTGQDIVVDGGWLAKGLI